MIFLVRADPWFVRFKTREIRINIWISTTMGYLPLPLLTYIFIYRNIQQLRYDWQICVCIIITPGTCHKRMYCWCFIEPSVTLTWWRTPIVEETYLKLNAFENDNAVYRLLVIMILLRRVSVGHVTVRTRLEPSLLCYSDMTRSQAPKPMVIWLSFESPRKGLLIAPDVFVENMPVYIRLCNLVARSNYFN